MRSRSLESAALKPIPATRSLPQIATDVLRDRIYAGDFEPGDRLIETTIATRLGVSRGTVRDALQALGAEGLVTHQPRRGWRVVELAVQDINEIAELRAAVEGKCAQLLSTSEHDSAVDELNGILRRMSKLDHNRNPKRAIELDIEFHETLCRVSGNRRLHAAFLAHAPLMRVYFHAEQVRPAAATTAAQHGPIVEAIKSRDPVAAQLAIDRHLELGRRVLDDYVASRALRISSRE